MSLIDELKRRNVIKVAGAYLALAWLVLQLTSIVVPAFELPAWTLKFVIWLGVIGFPCALVFAWIYELTPEGLKRDSDVDPGKSMTQLTSKRLDYTIIALLVLAIGLFLLQYLRPPVPGTAVVAPATASTPAVSADVAATPATARASAQAAAPAPDDTSIAVLPFEDMSEQKNQSYMSDGIAEELLNLLAKIPELRVIARTSSFAFKGKEVDITEIARKLNVAHVLEGSIRKSGNTIRITTQLIRASDSTHVWSETYDRPLDDIFAVQDEIAGAVVEQLKIKLLGAAPKAKEANPQAYALFLQARQLFRQSTTESIEQSIALSTQALALEPDYAAAWIGLASAYINQAVYGLRPVDEAYALAREAVNKALAGDPEFAEAHDGLGWIAMSYDGDLAAAARHYQRALALDPTNLAIIASAGTLAGSLGRVDHAIALAEYVAARDPISAILNVNLGGWYVTAKRYDEAIASWRTALRLSPGFISAQATIGQALLFKGDPEAALVEAQKEPDEIYRLYTLALVYRALGRTAEADAALAELMQKYEKPSSYLIAQVLSYRNEVDRAFEWLDKAVANHDTSLVNLATADTNPKFDNIRKDPRWLPFLRKLGKAPEQLAAIKFDVKLPQQ